MLIDPATDAQLTKVTDAVHHTLGTSAIGVYLYGSAVTSGLKPASDLDVFVVVDRSLTDRERANLTAAIMAISGRDRPIELTIVTDGALDPWPDRPRRDYQYGEWLRADYESGGFPQPTDDDDLAALVSTVHAGSHRLFGLEVTDLLAPVPPHALMAAMRANVPTLVAELDNDTENVLLTLARMAFTNQHGSIASKDAAATWVMPSLSCAARPMLEAAMAAYLTGEYGSIPAERLGEAHVTAAELIALFGQ